ITTSITAQQTKLDLKFVPKDNRLDIRKCNGRVPCGLKPKEETFQVVLDALALTPCYPAFFITVDIPAIDNRGYKKKEASQKYVAVLPECLTSPQMKESKVYKTYLGYATGTVPPKVSRKFKKVSTSKKDSMPIQQMKNLSRKVKELGDMPRNLQILQLHVSSSESLLWKFSRKEKERKKSLRDSHNSHPSGSGSVAEKPPSVEKITPPVTSEGTGDKPGVIDVTKDESTESEFESWGNDDDVSNDEEGREREEMWLILGPRNSGTAACKLLREASRGLPRSIKGNITTSKPQTLEEVIAITQRLMEQTLQVMDTGCRLFLVAGLLFLQFLVWWPTLKLRVSFFEFDLKFIEFSWYDYLITNESFSHFLNAVKREFFQICFRDNLDNVVKEEDGGWIFFLGGNNFSETKKYRGSNSSDGGNTGDGVKITGRVIGSGDGISPFTGSDRGLKKRKTSKDVEPTTSPKTKDSSSRSSKGTKSQPKCFEKSVYAEEPEFEVGDTDTPQGQERNQGNDNVEPRTKSAS
nr:hypothetical protein [Tanacetum cinerariifolium]